MPNDDRISEVYLRQRGDREWQRFTRERVDWICSQATGKSVLDIGCSQGIVPLLLGRRGFSVLGIDYEQPQIDYANSAIEKEPEDVRNCVEFVCDDVSTHDFGERLFDTVILGEVIEHCQNPGMIISCARERLVDGGRLVLTTPFGYLPHPDHFQVFFFSNFLDVLGDHFQIDELNTDGRYLSLLATKTTDAGDTALRLRDPDELARFLGLTEKVCQETQERGYAAAHAFQARLSQVSEKHQEANENYKRLQERYTELQERYTELQEQCNSLKSRSLELQRIYKSRTWFLAGPMLKLERKLYPYGPTAILDAWRAGLSRYRETGKLAAFFKPKQK